MCRVTEDDGQGEPHEYGVIDAKTRSYRVTEEKFMVALLNRHTKGQIREKIRIAALVVDDLASTLSQI